MSLRAHLPALALIALLSGFALWGAPRVPFHPDESTQLFTSADFETLFTRPQALGWQPEHSGELRQRYRLLDAPVTRYLLGAGRALHGLPPLPADWDWSKTWAQNAAAGALPSAALLTAGRAAIAALFPLTLALLYLSGCALGGRRVGLLAVLLLGLHPLALVHARRAMAEGALLFGVTFSLWALLAAPRRQRPLWLGLALGLAINAKQTALALLPLAAFSPRRAAGRGSTRGLLRDILLPLALALALTALLNPVFWSHPLAALRAAAALRADLNARQAADTARLAPGALLDTPGKRFIALAGNLFILPPQFAEVGNYAAETASVGAAYRSHPLHGLGRGLWGGGFFLALALVGAGRGLWGLLHRQGGGAAEQEAVRLLLAATLLQGGALLLLIVLPWQRYVVPLLPMTVLWQAYAFRGPQAA